VLRSIHLDDIVQFALGQLIDNEPIQGLARPDTLVTIVIRIIAT
jgi:hypothetical protein